MPTMIILRIIPILRTIIEMIGILRIIAILRVSKLAAEEAFKYSLTLPPLHRSCPSL